MYTSIETLEGFAVNPLSGPPDEASKSDICTTSIAWCKVFSLIALFLVVFGLMNFAELPLGWKD